MTHLMIGCHLSPSKGLLKMAQTAEPIHADTFQFFARNPRGSKAKTLDTDDADAMKQYLVDHHFGPILVHAPYTLNPSSENSDTREFAKIAMRDDLDRLKKMGVRLYNLHPGSHVGQGTDKGIQLTAELLNRIIPSDFYGTVLLETMAGQGTEIGSTFQELKEIIDRVDLNERIGVCLDTCHVFAAGYDIASDPDSVLTEFDKILGLKRLRYVHLNDSLFGLGMHKDRHAAIGCGEIGIEGFKRIINHPALFNRPFCLETPHETIEEYADEILLLRKMTDVG